MRLPLLLPLLLVLAPGMPLADTVPPQYNRVSLDASAQADVANDLLVAVLLAQAEGRDAATPADEVNARMDWALDLVKRHPELQVQTLGYHTSPIYDKGNIRGWRVSQSLRLESRDERLLGDLLAELQTRLTVQSIGYEVSEAQRRAHLEELTAEALARFTARARHVAESLGRSGYRLVRLNINDSRDRPTPVARGMMMQAAPAEASVAPARLEAGTQELTVSVNGEIELSED